MKTRNHTDMKTRNQIEAVSNGKISVVCQRLMQAVNYNGQRRQC